MIGYMVFNDDLVYNGLRYEVGKCYEKDVKSKDFKFWLSLADCFNYCEFENTDKVAEIEVIGDVEYIKEDLSGNTNKIRILRDLNLNEILDLVNEGYFNTGSFNKGSYNTGDYNEGGYNTGSFNVGRCNTGLHNIGMNNTGIANKGDMNTGNSNGGMGNTGNFNIGNWNTGDWNKSSHNNGCFMTDEPTIMMFNKPTNWTYNMWKTSKAYYLLSLLQDTGTKFIYTKDMTEEEKNSNLAYERVGGYLKRLNVEESNQYWWDGLSDEERRVIKDLPNFDAAIFKEITGVDTTLK